jgi:hypothetical protein
MMPAVIAECVGGPADGIKVMPPDPERPTIWQSHVGVRPQPGAPRVWYKIRVLADGKPAFVEIDGQKQVYYDYDPTIKDGQGDSIQLPTRT